MKTVKFKDVAHLYIGCRIATEEERYNSPGLRLVGIADEGFQLYDAGIKLKYYMTPECTKPIFRRLSSMREKEMRTIFNICYQSVFNHVNEFEYYNSVEYCNDGDGVGLIVNEILKIESPGTKEWKYGLTIEKSGVEFSANGDKLTVPTYEIFRNLLSLGFDLFGLIESGEAIEQP